MTRLCVIAVAVATLAVCHGASVPVGRRELLNQERTERQLSSHYGYHEDDSRRQLSYDYYDYDGDDDDYYRRRSFNWDAPAPMDQDTEMLGGAVAPGVDAATPALGAQQAANANADTRFGATGVDNANKNVGAQGAGAGEGGLRRLQGYGRGDTWQFGQGTDDVWESGEGTGGMEATGTATLGAGNWRNRALQEGMWGDDTWQFGQGTGGMEGAQTATRGRGSGMWGATEGEGAGGGMWELGEGTTRTAARGQGNWRKRALFDDVDGLGTINAGGTGETGVLGATQGLGGMDDVNAAAMWQGGQ